ncbi:MAG: preprotein translocase subunit SecY, partial [Verrucomicrobiae bacterium]|nr:preprotein translocase subunit SecY [Verrucomicrobiae bacterium]
MFKAFLNSFKIPELRSRLVFTLIVLAICRLGAAIPVPGVDAAVLSQYFASVIEKQKSGNIVGMLNIFSGGAIENCAILSLNVMPYITASIIFQILVTVIPSLQKIAKEEGGRQKISQYTRYATVAVCLFQAYILARNFQNPQSIFPGITGQIVLNPGWSFVLIAMMCLTSGTMFMMWLGERITDRGVGNGVSVLIAANILARFPSAVTKGYQMLFDPTRDVNWVAALLFAGFFFAVIGGVIWLTQTMRKITIQQAQRMVGRKIAPGGQTFLPLRLNFAGVMPIIFAQAIFMLPQLLRTYVHDGPLATVLGWFSYGSVGYVILYAVFVIGFSFFWVATMFNPIDIADQLKKGNAYIPGVRPGKPTADFLDYTMVRLTSAGAILLTVLAILPQLLYQLLKIDFAVASFFGGTSLLITVGVLLDTLRQIETYLL